MTWCHLSHFAPISAILLWSLTVEIDWTIFPKENPESHWNSWFPTRVTVWAEDAAKSVCFLPLAAGLLAHWGPVYAIYSVEGNITDVMTCFTLSDIVCVFVCACRASWGRSSWVMSSLTLSFLAGSSTASWGRRCSTETTPWPAGRHTFPRVAHNSRPVGHQNF